MLWNAYILSGKVVDYPNHFGSCFSHKTRSHFMNENLLSMVFIINLSVNEEIKLKESLKFI